MAAFAGVLRPLELAGRFTVSVGPALLCGSPGGEEAGLGIDVTLVAGVDTTVDTN